jgi:hypothetical protein
MPGSPRLPSRNAPFPHDHCVINIPAQVTIQNTSPGAPHAHDDEQTSQNGNLPISTTARGSSRNVAFRTKLAATLKTGIGMAVPVAAVSIATDMVVRALWNMAQHLANSSGSDIRIKLTAAGMGFAADAVAISVLTVAGHAYLDKKFYYNKDKSADEMIATKKANSAVFACVCGTGTPIAITSAATALTGGTVTASVVTNALITHAIGSVIATSAVQNVAALN